MNKRCKNISGWQYL